MAEAMTTGTRTVRVSYVPTGYGLALSLDDIGRAGADDSAADGILNVTDGCITLEIPAVDGRPAVLAWDPAEVEWDSMVA